MLNPILSFSATRRMRSFRTMLIVIGYVAALLLIALSILSPFLKDTVALGSLSRGPMCFLALLAAQFVLIILIAPAMTSGAVAGERERQTLDLLLVTNTRSFRIVTGKAMESFALLALLILCGLPVTGLCLLTGGISAGQILLGELFLLAEAFACVSVGVFCSSLSRSTVFSGVMSYLTLLLIGVVTLLPFLFGYARKITDVVYDPKNYAALTETGARGLLPKLLCLNPGFGLVSLLQGQTHILNETMKYRGWGRIYCTWLMADRAGWNYIAVFCAVGMILVSLALLGAAALLIRKGSKKAKHG